MKWLSGEGLEWLEAGLPGATVCFSTRTGGVSQAPFDSLNLGVLTADLRSDVLENRCRLSEALGIDGERVAMGLQVHGDRLAFHGADDGDGAYVEPVAEPEEADGHVTAVAGRPLLVLAADCLPVAVSGPGGLAMLHCGWRGLAGSLVGDAVRAVEATDAVIGPGIGPCCFEVGPQVLDAFESLGSGIAEGRMLDLPEVARRTLHEAGIERIESSGICTFCDVDRFFSHRRDGGVTGRQAGIAWLN